MILDEAHHAAPASGARYAVDSQFTRAVRDLARRFEHRLFLSATPHNGHSNSFSSLLEILDPQRFTRGVPVRPRELDAVMVRRLKSDLRHFGEHFRSGVVEPIGRGLAEDAPELVLSRMLAAYGALRARAADCRRAKPGWRGSPSSACSSGFSRPSQAFARNTRGPSQGLERVRCLGRPVAGRLRRGGAEDGGRADGRDRTREADGATKRTRRPRRPPPSPRASDRAAVDEMLEIAQSGTPRPDARVAWLARLDPGKHGAGRPLERAAAGSLHRIRGHAALARTTARGGTRRPSTRRSDRGLHRRHAARSPRGAEARASTPTRPKIPLRILICTDAAREGINLQTRCHDLIHFDLPWNPARLEQRNGRIDRKLQPSPKVWCRYFVYDQREEDVVLEALVRKTELIRTQLGSAGQVIADRITDRLARDGIYARHGAWRGEIDEQDDADRCVARRSRGDGRRDGGAPRPPGAGTRRPAPGARELARAGRRRSGRAARGGRRALARAGASLDASARRRDRRHALFRLDPDDPVFAAAAGRMPRRSAHSPPQAWRATQGLARDGAAAGAVVRSGRSLPEGVDAEGVRAAPPRTPAGPAAAVALPQPGLPVRPVARLRRSRAGRPAARGPDRPPCALTARARRDCTRRSSPSPPRGRRRGAGPAARAPSASAARKTTLDQLEARAARPQASAGHRWARRASRLGSSRTPADLELELQRRADGQRAEVST